VIALRSDALLVRLDPDHGAEILDLIDLGSGRQLLGRPPFEPAPARAGDLDEATWTASYRGGWQIVAPNAGNACAVAGVRHGFHGRASVDPWELLSQGEAAATLRWRGHGLELERRIEVTRRTITVGLSWTALARRTPLIALEHICFGTELLDPAVEIVAEARAHELSELDGPALPPADAPDWPRSRLLDGGTELAGSWPLARPRARLTALTGWRHGCAELRNPGRATSLRVAWDSSKLSAAWVWHEARASAGPWRKQAELLGFEPASVPHCLGLGEAIRHGQAWWAVPGRRDRYRLALTVA
jgi:hypothetical protein